VKNFKGQIATEYVMIMGFVLVITIPLFYYAMSESNKNIRINQADDAINTLARAADTVYSIGPGTKKYVWVNMPSGVETYSLANKEVLIKLQIFGGLSDVSVGTRAGLTGEIPISKGRHKVLVEMLESGYVQFGVADDTFPPVVTWVDPYGTINYYGIILRATTNEYSTCKYAEDNESYDSMTKEFVGSALTHEKDIGTLEEGNHVYYVRCKDPSENKMDYSAVINFTIVPPGEEPYEPDSPLITLIIPENNNKTNVSVILFEYNVTDKSSIDYCKLIIDNVTEQTNNSVIRNITQDFIQALEFGNHTWNINCTDVHGNRNSSVIWNISTNATADLDVPIVSLESPANNSIRNLFIVRFDYNVTDVTSEISYCSINMFGLLDQGGEVVWSIRDSPIVKNITMGIILPLFKANYTWNVSCVDDSYSANEGYSETWKVRVNMSAGEGYIFSCASYCGSLGHSGGDCRQNPGKCTSDGYVKHVEEGNVWCTTGPPTPDCCCLP
jgi:hypothetical protein